MFKASEEALIDAEFIEKTENKVKEVWRYFKKITEERDIYLYVDSGVTMNGEKLYFKKERVNV